MYTGVNFNRLYDSGGMWLLTVSVHITQPLASELTKCLSAVLTSPDQETQINDKAVPKAPLELITPGVSGI